MRTSARARPRRGRAGLPLPAALNSWRWCPAPSEWALLACLLAVAGCDGPQSVLAPHGPAARDIVQLWWIMAGGAVLIWLFVIGCAVYATRIRPRAHEDFAGTAFIVGGGVVLPVFVLSPLLIYSFLLARARRRCRRCSAHRGDR